MANWSLPTVTSNYLDVLNELKGRDVDASTMNGTGANQPVGAMHWSRSNKAFYEWNGSAHVVQVLGVAGGGTGSTTGSGAISNLGLGTMAIQNANAVNISGGSATLSSGVISGGTFTVGAVLIAQPNTAGLQMHNNITMAADGAYMIGSNGARPHTVYIRHALVLPVGFNKFAIG